VRSMLFDYEWQFLLQLIGRLGYCETYEKLCATLYDQMRTLIPFYKGVCFQTERKNGVGYLSNSFSTNSPDGITDHTFFMDGNYPHWSEFIMAPHSIVFRQSSLISPSSWENTRVYRNVWLPQRIYWGLHVSLIAQDQPLAIIGFYREKGDNDFSERDAFILNALIPPLESIFHNLLKKPGLASEPLISQAELIKQFSLTKRENEVLNLVLSNLTDDEICSSLFITQPTLNKHLSNIYKKTGSRSRLQLFRLVRSPN